MRSYGEDEGVEMFDSQASFIFGFEPRSFSESYTGDGFEMIKNFDRYGTFDVYKIERGQEDGSDSHEDSLRIIETGSWFDG